ncbi:MAG: murein hydrolase activator EnvC family protein [Candidatus Alkaliphilus sp. MAG34]|nr:M23 family metallopeptidase [Clostridiales bacterium]
MIMQKNRKNLFGGTFKKRNILIGIPGYRNWLKKMIIRIFVSAILLATVVMIQTSNFKQPKKMLGFIETKLESDFNAGACLVGIKKLPIYIHALGEKAITTIKIEHKSGKRFISPVDGEITTYFDEEIAGTSNISKGLIFTSEVGQDIYSVDDGIVIDVGSNKSIGNYMIIKHKGELLSVYKYIGTNHMNINQRAERGQVIGVSSGRVLLEVWYRNEPVDPIGYIDTDIQ